MHRKKSLIAINDLTPQDIDHIYATAAEFLKTGKLEQTKTNTLKGRTVITLFYEDSTRTRTSFEIAGKRLGADVINLSPSHSSVKKGESFTDTVKTLNAMRPDYLVIRHREAGSALLAHTYSDASIINAGDGYYQHPTQALIDMYVMQAKKGSLKGKIIAICGDILHSRVARSLIDLLFTQGAIIHLIAPPTLLPFSFKENEKQPFLKIFHSMREGLKNADIIYMLRLQTERMHGCFFPSVREYFHLYGLSYEKLKCANEKVIIMHPGPMNRGIEIDSMLADDLAYSVVLDQVETGVALRQALLCFYDKKKNT